MFTEITETRDLRPRACDPVPAVASGHPQFVGNVPQRRYF